MLEVYFMLLASVLLIWFVLDFHLKRRFRNRVTTIETELNNAVTKIKNPKLLDSVISKFDHIKHFIIFLYNPNSKDWPKQITIEPIESSNQINFKLIKGDETMNYYLKK